MATIDTNTSMKNMKSPARVDALLSLSHRCPIGISKIVGMTTAANTTIGMITWRESQMKLRSGSTLRTTMKTPPRNGITSKNDSSRLANPDAGAGASESARSA
ncbi:hypothetical protein ACVWXQ_002506 [Bradyrhizobium sp. S3.14.4]